MMTPDDLDKLPAELRALYLAADDATRAKMRPSIEAYLANTAELLAILEAVRAAAVAEADTEIAAGAPIN